MTEIFQKMKGGRFYWDTVYIVQCWFLGRG